MKKVLLIFVLIQILIDTGISQPCLHEGIVFENQLQINNFQANYPGCTEIEGDVVIQGEYIYNIDSLDAINTIGGNLYFYGCPDLESLNGLHNLYSVGGYLDIAGVDNTDFEGLANLISVGGDLKFRYLSEITNFDGLHNLSIVGGDFIVENNWDLINFEGLDNLTFIGGNYLVEDNVELINFLGIDSLVVIGGAFTVIDNYDLLNFHGLNSLTTISGDMTIDHNNNLLSIAALENLDGGTINELIITQNNSLNTCHAESICQYLSNPNGKITIHSNDDGCNSPGQIANNCGITMPCLPFGDYYFNYQIDIDSFQTNYLECTELHGYVEISGADITNLLGLNNITSVLYTLHIEDNTSLLDLTGLESLTHIGSTLYIEDNTSLIDFTGLESLSYIGNNLHIGSWDQDYQALTTLNGLDNLDSVGGSIMIIKNEDLTTLFSNNSLMSIGELYIMDNEMLLELNGLDSIGGSMVNLTINNNASLMNISLKNINMVNYILSIQDNESLSEINLTNLQHGEWLSIIDNPLLTDITSLSNLEFLWALTVKENDSLTNLNGLQNLTTINAEWHIEDNSNLTDISALANVEIENYIFIFIKNNPELSECDIQNICEYLLDGGSAYIENNNTGCNSVEEVEEACLTEVQELVINDNLFRVYPNPSSDRVLFEQITTSNTFDIEIQNLFGQSVKEVKNIQSSHYTLNVADLKAGVYFYVIKEKGIAVQQGKLIKK